MTHLAGEELGKLGIGFVSLHGGVPTRQRGALIEKFRSDPECKVFLSTDAGGVGLNLQAASAVVNFEPPWNPARLEQRIGRVHRLGQSRPVHVIHMLTSGSIEERVWETLRLKKSLFAGVFDSPTGEVSFEKLGRKTVFQAVKEIFADQPARPKPVVDQAVPVPLKAAEAAAAQQAGARSIETAAAGLIEAGVKFMESMASDGAGSRLEQILSGLFIQDARTKRPVLSIPLPESLSQERIARAISGLVNSLARAVTGEDKP
jgi:superfamily II DNA/RNA helicase